MNQKYAHIFYHIGYWIIVLFFLTLVFGLSWRNNLAAFYFVIMLFPIVIGTFYFFNYFLVPRYLLRERYFKFGLYTLYTIISSLYLEAIILMLSFIYLANFSFAQLSPKASDTVLLAIVLYSLVMPGAILLLSNQLKENQSLIKVLTEEKQKKEMKFLEIMANRKMVKIPLSEIMYVESFSDFVKVHADKRSTKTKVRISKMETLLPDNFMRIHRSYIVNQERIQSFTSTNVTVDNRDLTISRSYKQHVLKQLQSSEA